MRSTLCMLTKQTLVACDDELHGRRYRTYHICQSPKYLRRLIHSCCAHGRAGRLGGTGRDGNFPGFTSGISLGTRFSVSISFVPSLVVVLVVVVPTVVTSTPFLAVILRSCSAYAAAASSLLA